MYEPSGVIDKWICKEKLRFASKLESSIKEMVPDYRILSVRQLRKRVKILCRQSGIDRRYFVAESVEGSASDD